MAKLYLKLENEDGSFREYRKEKVNARWIKEGLKHSKKIKELERKNDAIAILEERLSFTVLLFGDKDLTSDAILDGLESDVLFDTLDNIFQSMMGYNRETKGEEGKL